MWAVADAGAVLGESGDEEATLKTTFGKQRRSKRSKQMEFRSDKVKLGKWEEEKERCSGSKKKDIYSPRRSDVRPMTMTTALVCALR